MVEMVYKQVAVVEHFFNIIYRCSVLSINSRRFPWEKDYEQIIICVKKEVVKKKLFFSVHVESVGETQLRGRAGRHCGQKRTYRAVSTL